MEPSKKPNYERHYATLRPDTRWIRVLSALFIVYAVVTLTVLLMLEAVDGPGRAVTTTTMKAEYDEQLIRRPLTAASRSRERSLSAPDTTNTTRTTTNQARITTSSSTTIGKANHGQTQQVPVRSTTTTVHTDAKRQLHRGYASSRECIAAVENHGDYGRSRNPTHFGRYQFSLSTWIAFGGKKEDWGHASPAEQDRVFNNAMQQQAYHHWTPYDGCG